MITKQYHRLISSAIFFANMSSLVDVNGNVWSGSYATDVPKFQYLSSLRTSYASDGGVLLGTGDDEPSMNDYQLSGSIITGLNATTVLHAAFDDNAASRMVEFTLSNITSIDKTIKEVAYIAKVWTSGNTGYFMLDRTVLAEPLTIPAGGVGKLRYMIEIKMPTE